MPQRIGLEFTNIFANCATEMQEYHHKMHRNKPEITGESVETQKYNTA